MRRRILGMVAAAAMATGGVVMLTETPAEAHGDCVVIHLSVSTQSSRPLHLCL